MQLLKHVHGVLDRTVEESCVVSGSGFEGVHSQEEEDDQSDHIYVVRTILHKDQGGHKPIDQSGK